MKYYTEDHEWIDVDGDIGTVGVTDYAQDKLGDLVYVEVPEVGKTLAKGAESAVVESVKAASEVYAPVSGEVIEVNEALADKPELVNSDAEGEGWFYKLKLSDPSELDKLKNKADYKEHVKGSE